MSRSKHVVGFLAMMLGLLSAALAQFGPSQQKPKGPWENKALAADERARLVVKEMTLDEKVQMVHGLGWMAMFMKPATGPGVRAISAGGFVPGVERLGIPDLQMTDSVLGVSGAGVGGRYATPLPSGEAMAAAWDPALSREIGSLLGAEVRGMGFNMSLGSGINMIREPRGGRTFEYKGEDPLLAATLASAELKAEKELGLITDLKHYAVNDQDEGRMVVNSVISKRAMRESDLLAFEIALRDSGADAVMCSYNKINGVYGCENEYTLGVLKKDFGFKGFVVSDWGATHSTANAVMAGLDMEMPNLGFLGAPLKKAVESGEVPVARLDDMVLRIVRAMFDSGIVDNPPHAQSPDVVRGFQVAQKTAERGTVLLKNASALLPLKADAIRSIAVIGGHADAGVISGGGSSQVSPPGGNAVPQPPPPPSNVPSFVNELTFFRGAPLEAIRAHAKGAKIHFNAGTDPAAAAAAARAADVAIVFAVQPSQEGFDQTSLALPDKQDALIEAVTAANPRTIVVLETSGAVLMPWIDRAGAVLEAWYPGICGSEAIANILFGEVNPSGKLPLTFPRSEADLPHATRYIQPPKRADQVPLANLPMVEGFSMNQSNFDAVYDEGLKVGYKWYDAEKKEPLFPFGYGLSYTSFSYAGVKAEGGTAGLTVNFRVKNTGARAGEETAQVYLTLPDAAGEPPRRLVGWSKVALEAGEEKFVTVKVEPLMLSVFDEQKDAWWIVPGEYTVWVGASSRALPLSAKVTLDK